MAEEQKRGVVTVICAVPNGVSLRLCRPHDPDGMGSTKVMVPYGEPVVLQGPMEGTGAAYRTTLEPVLNAGVDKEFFDVWMEQNARNPLVINRMIRLEDAPKDEPEQPRGKKK